MSIRGASDRLRGRGASEAQKRIDEARRSGAAQLDLSELGLSVLPPEIGQLANLTDLGLDGNQLSVLPAEIGQLANLTDLGLDRNQLSVLPAEISQLANLTNLRLDRNQLSVLPAEIGQLANLTYLGLTGNQLSVLPPEIGQLANLTNLGLNGNQLSVLPPEIGQLANLTYLGLDSNQLSVLPPEIGQLANLTELWLTGNQLSVLPAEIGQLANLTYLRLDRNQLSVLPPEIGQLANLTNLGLAGNPLSPALEAVLGRQGVEGLLDYLRRITPNAVTSRAGQAKVLVLGEGGVGKTSLVAQLCGKGFVSGPSTHGIEIAVHTEKAADGTPYLLRYWDFGGQDLYRITHQFFFTPDTLYVIVWHAREGADRGEVAEWIERIRLRLGDDEQARILLVATHCKDQNATVDHASLQQLAGPNIAVAVQPIQVDNSDGTGIDDLRAEILAAVQQLGLADTLWPASYQSLSEHLDDSAAPAITWTDFVGRGAGFGLSPKDARPQRSSSRLPAA